MKNKPSIKLGIFLLLLLTQNASFGQSTPDLSPYYNWFDAKIGIGNTGIYNGTLDVDVYKTEKGNHKFFEANIFKQGNITYDGQRYYNIDLKYDLYRDEVIAKLPNTNGHVFVKLIKEKISKFSIAEFNFISNGNFKSDDTKQTYGFYELMFKTPQITLLKKHEKSWEIEIIERFKYDKFTLKNYYAIQYKDTYYAIDAKNDLIAVFPEFKSEINTFYRKRKRLYKSDIDSFFTLLTEEISTFIKHSNEK